MYRKYQNCFYLILLLFFLIPLYGAQKILFCADGWGDIFKNGRIEMNSLRIWLENQDIKVDQVALSKVFEQNFKLKKGEKLVFFDQQWERISPINLEKIKQFPVDQIALVIFEPPVVVPSSYSSLIHNLFPLIFTFSEDLIDGIKYKKLTLPVFSTSFSYKDPLPFDSKKFLTAVFNNKDGVSFNKNYSAAIKAGKLFLVQPSLTEAYFYRNQFINFFKDKGLDLYGVGWDSYDLSCYKGFIEPTNESAAKINKLKKYKFVFAAENTKGLRGYITEKIFDVMVAGSVPVYPDYNEASSYIPKECFIDPLDFSSFEDLYTYLVEMKEEEYNKYLKAIKNFLHSKAALEFTMYSFHSLLYDFVTNNMWEKL